MGPRNLFCTAAKVLLLPREIPHIMHNQRSWGSVAYSLCISYFVAIARIHRLSASTKRPAARRLVQPALNLTEALLNALPHPLLLIGAGVRIEYVNTAAEDFFQMSASVLCRRQLTDVVAFGSPLIALVEQVQRNETHVNEYGVDLGSFRFDAPKLVDLYCGPLPEAPGRVLVLLQQRS